MTETSTSTPQPDTVPEDADAPTKPHTGAQRVLTRRQRDVLTLAAEGHTNAAIAAILHISVNAVAEHVLKARRALGARDRTHAVVIAHRTGLISLDILNEVHGQQQAAVAADLEGLAAENSELHRHHAEDRDQLTEMRATITRYRTDLTEAREQRERARDTAVALENDLARAGARLAEVKADRDRATEMYYAAMRDLGAAINRLDAARRELDRLALDSGWGRDTAARIRAALDAREGQ
ncbi:LuxR C-terminal-related transcriptional regulator [Streptomyces chumphonensis]|uniref:response regulator transcription factor n=1 Tax=Streptomyces chumphonensis TaxID=1214925 RepID=UPI003D7380AC